MTGRSTRCRAFVAAIGAVGLLLIGGPLFLPAGAPAGPQPAASMGPFGVAAQATAGDGRLVHGPVAMAAADPNGSAAPVRPAAYTTAAPGMAAAIAVEFALAQIGLPYVWGGDGPAAGDTGFDCSGLTHAAYATAGVQLPRTAQTQYNAGPLLPPGTTLQPGDLAFYGTPTKVHHVGMAIDANRMVNAPTFGKPVQVATIRGAGDDYIGASRPTARPGASAEPGAPVPPILSAPQLQVIATLPTTSGPPAAAPPTTVPPTTVPPTTVPPTTVPPTSTPPASVPPTTAPPTTAPPTTAPATTVRATTVPPTTAPATAAQTSLAVSSTTNPPTTAPAARTTSSTAAAGAGVPSEPVATS